MENREIAAVFDKMADLLEFQGANPFRVRAYRNGSRRLQDLPDSVSGLVETGEDLTKIDGIGKDLADKITVLVKTGELPQLNELLAEIPVGVLTLLRIPGLGPKKAAAIYKELGIETLADLRAACEAKKIRDLKGFGAKTEESILAGIGLAEHAGDRIYWATADEIVQALIAYLKLSKAVKQIEAAGSYRRGRETVGDLDVLVDAKDAAAVMDHFAKFPEVAETIARGDTKMSVRLHSGLQVDLRVVPTKSFGAALQYFTGSKEHNIVLRGLAKDRGLKISEWGIFRVEKDGTEEYLAGKTEADLYAVLDLPVCPPELRENRGEFAYKKKSDIPKLVELDDIQGDLHMHTSATDGKETIRAMAAAAQERGLKYIAITDHSKRVSMARGLDATRLREQWDEIDRVNKELDGITVLKGIECDILERGGMDLDDEVLAEADWVVASIHYGQNQDRAQITERIIGAIENPWVSVVAHPTGRLINKRERYAVDLEAVMKAATANGKLLELNANPARLDLDDVHCARAKQLGIPIVISSDAHSIGGLDVLRYGVKQARRAGLTAKDVANTRTWSALKRLVRRGS